MTSTEGARRKAEIRGKNRSSAGKLEKRLREDVVVLIDTEFAKLTTLIENGTSVRRTIFQEIYCIIWVQEMSGKKGAINVRRQYEKFAREQSPDKEQEIVIIHTENEYNIE